MNTNNQLPEKQNIAVFINSLAGGGAERVVSYLLPYLVNNAFRVHLILNNNTIICKIPDEITLHLIENSKIDTSEVLKFLKLPLLAIKYHRILRKENISISLSFLSRPSYISILSKYLSRNKTKIIISERSHPSSQYNYGNLKSLINRFLIRNLYKKSDLIITNSRGNSEDLIKNFNIPPELIKTIHNPIDIELINSQKALEGFFDTDFFNIITVGRLDAGKNHELLIHSMAVLKGKKIRLYILGTGILHSYLQNMIQSYHLEQEVFLLGFDKNPYQYLKAADLFVFSSNHEGFPNVILEAMACGLPIVSTDCPAGPREIMCYDSKSNEPIKILKNTPVGILIPLNNIDSMVNAIQTMQSDSAYYETCVLNIKNRILDFAADKKLKEYLDLLQQ
jgi:N-acetylgalactosamine-N,N'-diacetylbacillosaminyl-diphospho-undecaprenol 4-alpha-N-acetylgalactosaminyltransferase